MSGEDTVPGSALTRQGLAGPWIPDAPLALAHTDWLRNLLTVSGPAAEVRRFHAAARGTNAIPWHLDLDYEENRLLAPMATLVAALELCRDAVIVLDQAEAFGVIIVAPRVADAAQPDAGSRSGASSAASSRPLEGQRHAACSD